MRGSRAGDLFAGQQTRAREDVEIAVPATGFGAICEALDELEFELAGWGRLCRPSTAAPKDDADFAATAPRMTLGDLASG